MPFRASILFSLAATCSATAQDAEKPAFDEGNIRKTFAWITELHKPIKEAAVSKNALAKAQAEKQLAGALDAVKGKRIDWEMSVLAIEKRGVPAKFFTDGRIGIQVVPPLGPKDRQSPDPYARSYPFPVQGDWVLSAKANDPLRVQGKIVSWKLLGEDPQFLRTVRFTISDHKLSPVK